jgi:hypothetical protein
MEKYDQAHSGKVWFPITALAKLDFQVNRPSDFCCNLLGAKDGILVFVKLRKSGVRNFPSGN